MLPTTGSVNHSLSKIDGPLSPRTPGRLVFQAAEWCASQNAAPTKFILPVA